MANGTGQSGAAGQGAFTTPTLSDALRHEGDEGAVQYVFPVEIEVRSVASSAHGEEIIQEALRRLTASLKSL